jgi:hypothetical protein
MFHFPECIFDPAGLESAIIREIYALLVTIRLDAPAGDRSGFAAESRLS